MHQRLRMAKWPGFLLATLFLFACSPKLEETVPVGQDIYKDGLHYFIPSAGFVPDSSTAVRLAEVVLAPVYGERTIRDEQPFKASLRDSVWVVEGHIPANYVGGVAVVEIGKRDGRVLRMSHGL